MTSQNFTFTGGELRQLAPERLMQASPASALDFSLPSGRGDYDLNPDYHEDLSGDTLIKAAAVLVPVIDYDDGARVLLTQRPDTMPSHPGQVAFPGGKAEDEDDGLIATALREAQEEVGLDPALVDVVGFLDTYHTATGFRISPVVGIVHASFTLDIDSREVDEAFEVPLEFLMSPQNHKHLSRVMRGKNRAFYAMPYDDKFIWGATAGMLKNFYDRVYLDG